MRAIVFVVLFPVLCLAQLQFIPISADYAAFNQSDSTAYVEVYLTLFQGSLQYKFENDTAVCTFLTKTEITKNGDIIKESQHKYQNTVTDTANFKSYNQFVDLFAFELPYDEYTATVTVHDLGSELKGEYILEMELAPPVESIHFSDIELATRLERDAGSTLFNKNGLVVVPNPRNTFDILSPVMYFYVELYGLDPSPDANDHYEFQYFITDNDGDTVKASVQKNKKIIASSQVEAGGFNVISLPQDVYFLNVVATSLNSENTVQRRKKFYVHKPQPKTELASETSLPAIDEIYTTMTKEELEEEFTISKYIADRNEEKIFKNLENTEAMRKFLTTFWRDRDKGKEIPVGTSRRNYLQLVNYSNQNFGSFRRDGWRTDRGRVLLIYGRPSEVERFPSSLDRLPYVIWYYYELEGGAKFIFCDRDGFGEYELIHSTYRKELSNPDWQRIVNKAASGPGSMDDGF